MVPLSAFHHTKSSRTPFFCPAFRHMKTSHALFFSHTTIFFRVPRGMDSHSVSFAPALSHRLDRLTHTSPSLIHFLMPCGMDSHGVPVEPALSNQFYLIVLCLQISHMKCTLPFILLSGRNRTLTLIEREDDTRSWRNFLIYFSHSTTMSCPPKGWGYILIGC
jgi:hypothetical protein